MTGFKTIRVAVLLLILFMVAMTTWLDQYRSTRWRVPLFVAIYPIAAERGPAIVFRAMPRRAGLSMATSSGCSTNAVPVWRPCGSPTAFVPA